MEAVWETPALADGRLSRRMGKMSQNAAGQSQILQITVWN